MNSLIHKLKPVLYVFIGFGVLNLLALFAQNLFAFPLRPSKYGFLIFAIAFPQLALIIYSKRSLDDLQLLSKFCRIVFSVGLLVLIVDLTSLGAGLGVGNRATNWAIGVFDVVVAVTILWGFNIIHRHRVQSALLSVTTFWSFLREFSPLEVCGGGIGRLLMIRSRVSVDCAGLHRESRRDSNAAVSMSAVI
jgi:hypothetical protein